MLQSAGGSHGGPRPFDVRSSPRYAFGPFVLDARNRKLLENGAPVTITSRVLDLLVVLVEHEGQPLDKERLMQHVWREAAVEEGNLARHISTLRKVLRESDQQRYVATLPGRGYQFVAPVRVLDPAVVEPASGATAATPAARPRVIGTFAIVATAVLVTATAGWLWMQPRPASDTDRRRIIVLPFENLTGDAHQEFFADGLTEEMIAELSRLHSDRLAVLARTSAMSFKGTKKTIADIRRDLDVDYVVEGSARRVGDRVRITAQLIETQTQTHLWSRSYDRDSADALGAQVDVARAIAREIRLELTPQDQARLERARTLSGQAHESYLRGRFALSQGTEPSIREAIEYFEGAAIEDPDYALAYAGIADAVVALTDFYVSPAETGDRGRRAALRAIELDETLAEAHTSLGVIHLLFDWDWPAAERELRRALELRPSYADAHSWYGYYLVAMGRPAEAIEQVTATEALDPLSVATQLHASWVYYLARRPEEAMAHVRRALALDPHPAIGHGAIWVAYAPVPEFLKGARIEQHSSSPLVLASLAGAAAVSGDHGEAERLLREIDQLSTTHHVCWYEVATVYAALHKADEAFRYLERSVAEHSMCLPDLRMDPRFDPIRADPRFAALLGRLQL
jgi:TolB-like protein/DNA-binding winged helix-turn-helix (wHTH) protein